MITIIAAVSENGAIGRGNDLLWHISGDMRRFKRLTTGHTVIMGRKTYESLPRRPLPDRRNIVLSHGSHVFDGAEIFSSVEAVLKTLSPEDEHFIIGGGSIYRQFLPFADKMYITRVHRHYEADTFFPNIDRQCWHIVDSEPHTDNEPPFTYITLTRIKH